MPRSACYEWDTISCDDVVLVKILDGPAFVSLLTTQVSRNYRFTTQEAITRSVSSSPGRSINNRLLGALSEFSVYVLRRKHEKCQPPFIHCFRAPDPLGFPNFPLVDVGIFQPGAKPSGDILHLQEIKASRRTPRYVRRVESDYRGLYAQSRLTSTVEHMKFDLTMTNQVEMVRRINDCLGTSPADSSKISLVPTGVSGSHRPVRDFQSEIEAIVGRLRSAGWPLVRGMHLRIPDIEDLFTSFATGKGISR